MIYEDKEGEKTNEKSQVKQGQTTDRLMCSRDLARLTRHGHQEGPMNDRGHRE